MSGGFSAECHYMPYNDHGSECQVLTDMYLRATDAEDRLATAEADLQAAQEQLATKDAALRKLAFDTEHDDAWRLSVARAALSPDLDINRAQLTEAAWRKIVEDAEWECDCAVCASIRALSPAPDSKEG